MSSTGNGEEGGSLGQTPDTDKDDPEYTLSSDEEVPPETERVLRRVAPAFLTELNPVFSSLVIITQGGIICMF